MAYITFQPSDYFNTKLYTGNGSTQSITGVGFQPDWCWIKGRGSSAYDHQLFDAVRGATKAIASNDSAAEATYSNSLTSFDSDGFSLGSFARTNSNSDNKVSWNWKAGTTSGISGGTITPSSYSFNTTAGISIIKYTGNATQGATLPHGLGAAPKMIIIKSTSNAEAWVVGHEHMNATNPWDYYIHLHDTGGRSQNNNRFGNVSPTTSVFTLGNEDQVNSSSKTYIAYCFAEKKGFSKFGVYTGNGNADGAFVYTGFKPAFLMIKERDNNGESWIMLDSTRSTENVTDEVLFANSNQQEEANQSSKGIDFCANGFKIRSTDAVINDGEKYIYMAFAEEPVVASNGDPATAR